MKVATAYCGVVLIWATTPLAIKWSNSSLSFIEAVTARMSFALVLALIIAAVLDKRIFQNRSDWRPMLIGALKLYPVMLIVYWSAQHIPSGLISVVFGSTPFFVGIFSFFVLGENQLNLSRVVALIFAVVGLSIIHIDQLYLGANAAWGVAGILVATVFFALGTVMLKKVGGGVEPVRQLAGSLLIAAPCFLITWVALDGELPESIDMRSATGVIYLVIAGSVIGGLAFYYVLLNCRVATVSLIPLITPVAALIVGYLVDGEKLDATMFTGIVFVLGSLALYQGAIQYLVKCLWRVGANIKRRRRGASVKVAAELIN